MLKVNSYSNKGIKSATTVTLPATWETKENKALLSQAMRVYTDRSHSGLHQAKTRTEVNRTTKKVYAQKGTGGARHGARSAPTFVGGGASHGPRAVSRELSLSTAMKRKVLGVAITQAVKEEKVHAADLGFKKTNEAQKFIEKLVGKNFHTVTFVLKEANSETRKYLRNIKNVKIVNFPDLNVFDVFFGGNIVFEKSIFEKEVKAKTEKPEVKKAKPVKKEKTK